MVGSSYAVVIVILAALGSGLQFHGQASLLEILCYASIVIMISFILAMTYAVQTRDFHKHVDVEKLRKLSLPPDSLFRIFQSHLVPMEEIRSGGYSVVLSLVQELTGVQPTGVSAVILWKPAFECYNLIAPNFLNLPQLLLPGYGITDLVSLSVYVSSLANGCFYCTSHCCSFAMRRGVDPFVLRNALDALLPEKNSQDDASQDTKLVMTPRERATIRVAYGLGTVPACLQLEDVIRLEEELSPGQSEWIVAATAMFGSFNKYMDGLAIPLESDIYAETKDHLHDKFVPNKAVATDLKDLTRRLPVPPKDDWTKLLACIYFGLRPGGALALDIKLGEDVPTEAEECVEYLRGLTGATFSVLYELQHGRFRRAVTAILAKNFVSDGISLRTKALAGIQYCGMLENKQLQDELKQVLGSLSKESNGSKATDALLLQVAKALSYNPSRMTAKLVDEIEVSPVISVENIVEIVSFLACLQALHRIEVYYQVRRKWMRT